MVAPDRSLTDVLVVGAGPTGLATALQVCAHGGTVRIVERRPAAPRPSRAMILHPRTLEVLRPLGVTDALLERADTRPRAELHVGRRVLDVRMDHLLLPDSAFPHLTLIRQMDVEAVLSRALEARGVVVERGTELTGLVGPVGPVAPVGPAGPSGPEGRAGGEPVVEAMLRTASGAEPAASRFVVGCDGPASITRESLGIGWRGAAYRQEVVLADLDLDSALTPGVLHAVAGRNGLVFLFALGEGASWRMLATRAAEPRATAFGQPGEPVPRIELQEILDAAGLPAAIARLAWSARVPLQHRIADSFRSGRVFLAGDAAHTHSPAGGQGMNTGIQDALNLGWKLAYAARGGRPHATLLASYEQERRPVAQRVLALTHLIFFAEASTTPVARWVRSRLAPLVAPAVPMVLRRRRLVAEGVRTLSQLRTRYPHSPISIDLGPAEALSLRVGDRLGDEIVAYAGRRVGLQELTASPGVHLLTCRDAPPLHVRGRDSRVALHRLEDRAGGSVVAVRPDGYVGFRSPVADSSQTSAWLDLVAAR